MDRDVYTMSSEGEIASKRVALTPGTWATLSNLRKPARHSTIQSPNSYPSTSANRLIADLDEIDATEKTVTSEKAKKGLGLS